MPNAQQPDIAARYEEMHARDDFDRLAHGAKAWVTGIACAALVALAAHLLGDLGARVSADIATAAAASCGAC